VAPGGCIGFLGVASFTIELLVRAQVEKPVFFTLVENLALL